MSGDKISSKERSYEELSAAYARLEAESGQQLIMQRDLIRARDQIDGELMRFKAIQTYIANTLSPSTETDFFLLTLEALIEAFELEVALFLQPGDDPDRLNVSASFGFETPPITLSLKHQPIPTDQSIILNQSDPLLMNGSDLNLHQAILRSVSDERENLSGVILLGITQESADYYEPISSEIESAFSVMVQQAGALWNNRQLTSKIVVKNEKLKQEAGQLLIMQRDLVQAKDQIDDELMRFKAIQTYIANALDAETPEQFFAVTLEAIIEAFEFEVALFVSPDTTGEHLDVISEFGFEVPPVKIPFSPEWFDHANAHVAHTESPILSAWESLGLHQAILCPFVDKSETFAGAIIAGITHDSVDYFDPITDEQTSAFSVMVQQAGALWMTRQLNDEIKRQNEQLVSLTKSYSRFVPFEFLDLLEKDSIEDIDAGANASIDMSVLFLDIRGFTALTEKLGPADTFTWLNEFLHEMEPIIARQKGFINQFQGDAIMALFPGAADAALRCAAQMITATQQFNKLQESRGKMPIKFGLGVNSGPVMLGAIGGENRIESNIVGDAANLAARTEGLTKFYGVNAIFTEFTHSRIANPDGFFYRELDRVTVKGREGAVTIYELLPDEDLSTAAHQFAKGLVMYRAGNFDAAKTIFEACKKHTPNDNAATLYVNRCTTFMKTPPDQWDGVSIISEK